MIYEYDIQQIKEELTLDQIFDILNELGAEPKQQNDGVIVSRTICHNEKGEGSWKLYYYDNSHLFHCFTSCGSSFDIFELVLKIMQREQGSQIELPQAIQYVAQYFGYAPTIEVEKEQLQSDKDFTYISNIDRIKNISLDTQTVELKAYDDKFLKNFPCPIITPWIDEGIDQEIMNRAGICYDPKNQGVVIPHYDINNRLIGIRERTLIQEQAEKYGKYMPARIAGKMYNHPLSFSVYNLNHSKENIQKIKKAIVFESEKSCLKYRSFFGEENDISCAVCGSNLIKYQFWLIQSCGAEEIIIGFDRQYKEIGDEEYHRWIKKLKDIAKKYFLYCNITFLFDTKNLLDYKDAPVDKGAEIFLQLFKERLDKDGKTR